MLPQRLPRLQAAGARLRSRAREPASRGAIPELAGAGARCDARRGRATVRAQRGGPWLSRTDEPERADTGPESQVYRQGARLSRYLVLLIALTGAVLFGLRAYRTHHLALSLSRTVMDRSTSRLRVELGAFFDPVERDVETIRHWCAEGHVDLEADAPLRGLAQALLAATPQTRSALIARGDGRLAFILSRADPTDAADPGAPGWVDPEAARASLDRAVREGTFAVRERPWYRAALASAGERPVWVAPYRSVDGTPGITCSARWESRGETYVLGLDVRLVEISALTAGHEVSPGGLVAVLAEDGSVVGHPRGGAPADAEGATADQAAFPVPAADLAVPSVRDAARRWQALGRPSGALRFDSEGEGHWASFAPFTLGGPGRGPTLWLCVVLPERDLLGDALAQRNIILGVTAAALAAGIVVTWLLRRALRRSVGAAMARARRLGQYQLREQIGSGGMGRVYRAWHVLLRRPTAIKLLHGGRSDPVAQRRFEREVRLTSQLTHPNTIAIFDYGHTPDGVFYYAMEYLDGVDLQRLVEATGPLPPSRVIHILRQACESLAEAHALGLIHRDVKPANLILCERGRRLDVVKVLDFGLVKDLVHVDVDLTNPHAVAGTPLYTSPEALTDPEQVGPASDLYALGAVAYFLLTGRTVFEGRVAVAVWAQHVNAQPLPPSTHVAGIPADVEAIVLRCLAKAPEDRPASAEALGQALAACADAERWTQDDARRWWEARADLKGGRADRGAGHGPESLDIDIDLGRREPESART
jgi:hypothetical protein